jgi:hypothetical protein
MCVHRPGATAGSALLRGVSHPLPIYCPTGLPWFPVADVGGCIDTISLVNRSNAVGIRTRTSDAGDAGWDRELWTVSSGRHRWKFRTYGCGTTWCPALCLSGDRAVLDLGAQLDRRCSEASVARSSKGSPPPASPGRVLIRGQPQSQLAGLAEAVRTSRCGSASLLEPLEVVAKS